jgi:TorA maturation chaperone TorD
MSSNAKGIAISSAFQAGAVDEVERARALLYRLLAHALAQPPDEALLDMIATLDGEDGALGEALRDVAAQASIAPLAAVRAEYDALFIGVARGELLPYASFYLTGFLHERPLARLRAELDQLGLSRAEGRSDPEDHAATICDVMATLVETGSDLQAGFFARHIAPWAVAFFTDLERAPSARLYRSIGALGRLLVELDRQGFDYAADIHSVRGAA